MVSSSSHSRPTETYNSIPPSNIARHSSPRAVALARSRRNPAIDSGCGGWQPNSLHLLSHKYKPVGTAPCCDRLESQRRTIEFQTILRYCRPFEINRVREV